MQWSLEKSDSVTNAFKKLGETNSLFSEVHALRFTDDPQSFPVMVSGTATCPGCDRLHSFQAEVFAEWNANAMITCADCGVVFLVYAVYRPSYAEEGEAVPVYLYADLYSYRQGQPLSQIILDVTSVG